MTWGGRVRVEENDRLYEPEDTGHAPGETSFSSLNSAGVRVCV
jgi:hypothetical protein